MTHGDKRIVVIAGIPIYKAYIEKVEGEKNNYEWLGKLKITMKSGFVWEFGLCSKLWRHALWELWEIIEKQGGNENE